MFLFNKLIAPLFYPLNVFYIQWNLDKSKFKEDIFFDLLSFLVINSRRLLSVFIITGCIIYFLT